MIRHLRDHQGGSAAIEFALVSPIFLAIVLVVMAPGLGFWMKNDLQGGTTDAT